MMTEIGRLREITFREVGEGTNNAIDLDDLIFIIISFLYGITLKNNWLELTG
jgi:hypothetical protein